MTSRYHSSSYSAKCTNRATYVARQNTWCQRSVDLSEYEAAILDFWDWVNCEPAYDYLSLEFHSATGWTEVWRRSGHFSTWHAVEVAVPVTTDSIRFRFVCDDQMQYEGVYIDDVRLVGYLPNVGVTRIVSPASEVDSGIVVVPACSVHNYSPATSTYQVRCRIGSGYTATAQVNSHPGFTSRLVVFSAWNPGTRGTYPVRCSTMLATDADPTNDHLDAATRVRVHDAGAVRIIAPFGSVDSGYTVTPRAYIRNFGTETESVVATLRLGSFYQESREAAGLASGESAHITFPSRIVTGPRGPCAVVCTTYLETDRNPANDTVRKQLDIRVHDVGAIVLLAPGPTIDSGARVAPYARVWNFGSQTEDFDCVFRLGSGYCDTQAVAGLAPQSSRYVLFDTWSAVPGTSTRACSTMLGSDLVDGNDRVAGTLFVRYLDGAVTRILAPHYQIVPGPVTPLVEVGNTGNVPFTDCRVSLRIEPGYLNSRVVSLNPGQLDTVAFDQWYASPGTFVASACIEVPADMGPANDSVRKNVTVGATHHDVGVSAIVSPARSVDPGDVIPCVRVYNYGSAVETDVPVVLWVENEADQVFADTGALPSIAPGEEREVALRTWLAYTGRFAVRSWTTLAGDETPGNDTCRQSVIVALHDASPTEVLAPAGAVGRGFPLAPRLRLCSRGTVADTFFAFMRIEDDTGSVYLDSTLVAVAPSETLNADFAVWVPPADGAYQAVGWTGLAGDYRPWDDTLWQGFFVEEPVVDLAAADIVVPSGTAPAGKVTPVVLVRNEGNVQTQCRVGLNIDAPGIRAYSDSAWTVPVIPSEELAVELPSWNATPGRYTTAFGVGCAGDVNPANDSVWDAVTVTAQGTWQEMSSVPLLPSSRAVKDGGSLAPFLDTEPALYCLKGNKTGDFYANRLNPDSWVTLPVLPRGTEARDAYRGACMVSDNSRYVYAVKGNNTYGFWRFDVWTDSWRALPPIPAGPSRKAVKGGTDVVYALSHDTGWVYLLKGVKTDFFRFNTLRLAWDTALPPAPAGSRPKYDKGSFLVSDGDSAIFAHKAKYHELWQFDLRADTWHTTALPGMPLVGRSGRSKKAKDGSCGALFGFGIYALKGGNTQEFWTYLPRERTWVESETIPSFGSAGRKKRVKAGADLAAFSDRLWALKGNKTREFWSYAVSSAAAPLIRSGATAGPQPRAARFGLVVRPVPARARASFICSWPGPTPARLDVIDVAGRLALTRTLARSSSAGCEANLDIRHLRAGIYFARLAASGRTSTAKLVVER
jgi:hypothetical protein